VSTVPFGTILGNAMIESMTPPYIAVGKLEKAIQIISSKPYSSLAPTLFISNGFSNVDALLALSALKFLDLIDAKGNATSHMPSIRFEGEKRTRAFASIIKTAYAPLFKSLAAPELASNTDLVNAFKEHYPTLSDRILKSAIPAFLRLCIYAGLKEEGSVKGRTLTPRHANKDISAKKIDLPGTHDYPLVKGKLTLSMPEDWLLQSDSSEELHDKLRAVVKAAQTFAAGIEKKKDSKKTTN
jgi:hypothetical protein